MPNWCDNTLSISNADKMKIDALEVELQKKDSEILKLLRPYEGEWDYGWCIENWGTKWDANVIDFYRDSDNDLTIYFETAWGPPTELYSYLHESDEGWEVEAYYHEPGMCFVGSWRNGDEEYYEYSDLSADEIDDELPEELNEMYGISEYKRQCEEEEEEWEEPADDEWEKAEITPELQEHFQKALGNLDEENKTEWPEPLSKREK